ncbi:nicotinate (nicotinamide) nucleotide adenylyltransferase [Oleidesulfovibrio alaskensis G20]|uniref:Probable nicotinate-nucleotide adenylyltransferase n=1 Tax=Oleidesulfovibrio alaskensis (strain ATCC BAA-1058 / DSM 17464 / G20) TaxID=207559 RepID=Q311G7_OLEA2|nr:nicotinate (nicotinamide) nucleotide adenylyltransferase [Oleidesulfovibrio alaskensis]ABB38429.1 nicotinate (nicotinamide) nucleotide adenylyltransferase [Oleidesulfovibrio alaskensis G20]MBG0773671.1 nicotinate (nicotinamide) nucleotide adenylyltransferase [Oleidesulfovibrio alaskensis]
MHTKALFGGTFNPPHVGHLRLIIEIYEALGLETVELLPCSIPPHKDAGGILPFALRCSMLEAMVQPFDWARVNRTEGERSGPSYTYDTLRMMTRHTKEKPLFVMGAGDFPTLPAWHKGTELADMADLLVVTRGTDTAGEFMQAVHDWPGSALTPCMPQHPAVEHEFHTAANGRILYMPIPALQVSASLIRERWLQRRSIHGLVPDNVIHILNSSAAEVQRSWT